MRKLTVLITMLVGVMFNVVANETVVQGKKVAVLPFAVKGNLDALYAETAQDMFMTELAKSKMYQIVVRSQVDKAMKDLKIQSGSDIDESSAMEIGKIAGTEIVVIGEIIALNNQSVVNVRGINVNSGVTEFTEKEIVNSQGELFAIDKIAKKLSGSNDYAAQNYNANTWNNQNYATNNWNNQNNPNNFYNQNYPNQSSTINFSATLTETNQLFVEDYFLGKWGIDPRDTPRVHKKYKKYLGGGVSMVVVGGILGVAGIAMMGAGFGTAFDAAFELNSGAIAGGIIAGSFGSIFLIAGLVLAPLAARPLGVASKIKSIHKIVTGKKSFTPRVSTTGGFNGENKLEIALGYRF